MDWISHINAEELIRIDRSAGARSLKREYVKLGYDNQMSTYGVLRDKETGDLNSCRIEVLSNTSFTERIVFLIYQTLYQLKPQYHYTIFIYDKDRDAIRMIGAYETKEE